MTTMTTKALAALLLALALPSAVLAESEAPAADAPPEDAARQFSEAETRMWMTDQLRAVAGPSTLHYEFERSGSFDPEANLRDKVRLDVLKLNQDGSRDVKLQFFQQNRFPVETLTINPVLRTFLEGDVNEMAVLTDPTGKAVTRWRVFMRSIKLALAETALVKPVDFEFAGQTWRGHEISFVPYANDPHRGQFEKFAGKRYRVIVSEELPGYVYRIETEVPPEKGGTEPLLREVLQLTKVQPSA